MALRRCRCCSRKKPDLVVIMASTLTRRNAEISLKALALGAADYIPKPDQQPRSQRLADFRRELIEKIRQLGCAPSACAVAEPPADAAKRPRAAGRAVDAAGALVIALRPMPSTPPRVLADRRLDRRAAGADGMLRGIDGRARASAGPDHPAHAADLHRHPGRASGPQRQGGRRTRRATAKQVDAGAIYIAPGGRHMSVARRDGSAVIALDDGPLVNFCKPAVDPLFASAAARSGAARCWRWCSQAWAPTGLPARKRSLPPVAASWRRTRRRSVVWGMPGPVAQAGLCSAVLPLDEIAPQGQPLFRGARMTRMIMISAQVAEGALRPGAVGREAISGRKPADAARAQARHRRPRRTGRSG